MPLKHSFPKKGPTTVGRSLLSKDLSFLYLFACPCIIFSIIYLPNKGWTRNGKTVESQSNHSGKIVNRPGIRLAKKRLAKIRFGEICRSHLGLCLDNKASGQFSRKWANCLCSCVDKTTSRSNDCIFKFMDSSFRTYCLTHDREYLIVTIFYFLEINSLCLNLQVFLLFCCIFFGSI